VDPNRIAAGGGSAGGHLAAATSTLPGLDDPNDDKNVSATANALLLFNPALVMAPAEGYAPPRFDEKAFRDRFGCDPREISPIHHVSSMTPPTLVLHGKADTLVPYAGVEAFAAAMKAAGARCDLIGYEGHGHGFFNGPRYEQTLAEADKFLVSLGFLPAANE
jgi:acetyl esterase/lipase